VIKSSKPEVSRSGSFSIFTVIFSKKYIKIENCGSALLDPPYISCFLEGGAIASPGATKIALSRFPGENVFDAL
jgi:hypothetical protein